MHGESRWDFFCCLLSLKLGVGATTFTACFSLECCILSVTSALAFGKGHRVDWLCPVTWLTERARDWVKAATHIFAPCALFWYRSLTRQKGNEKKSFPASDTPAISGILLTAWFEVFPCFFYKVISRVALYFIKRLTCQWWYDIMEVPHYALWGHTYLESIKCTHPKTNVIDISSMFADRFSVSRQDLIFSRWFSFNIFNICLRIYHDTLWI